MAYERPLEILAEKTVREGTRALEVEKFLRDNGITCPDMIQASIESETNLVERIEDLLKAEGELDAFMTGIAGYVKTMNARSKGFKGAKDFLREKIVEALDRAKQQKVKTAFGTVYTQADPFTFEVTNEVALPDIFFKQVVDTDKIKEVLKDRAQKRSALAESFNEGQEVEAILALWQFDVDNPPIPGVEIDETTYSLRIRRN